jgi:cell wall-associated NlpC family hydrolase
MHGVHVTYAQKMLNEYGVWVGAIDGVFGEFTGRACSEAKYKLGYAKSNITPTYGTQLDRFLNGTLKQTVAMKIRAKQRVKKQTLPATVISVAREYIGTKESPAGSNRVLFSDWYGIIGPWCAMFVTYCFVKAGSKAFVRGERWAYCPFILADARQQKNGLCVVASRDAVRGDIVLYSWNRDGVANHVGILLTPVDANGNFTAIEGNTSEGNDSNGGEVMVRSRNFSSVIAFVRVIK